MARRTIVRCAAFTLLSLAACHGTPAAGSGADVVIDTVDGVPRMTYSGSGGPALDWTLDTVVVVGDIMSGDEHYMLGRVPVTGVAGDARGDLFVLDAAAQHVLCYDSAGSYVATYGRQGNGPGELAQPYSIGVGPGDTLWVQGISTHRLTGFPIAGGEARGLTEPAELFIRSALAAVPGAFVTEAYPLPSVAPGGKASDDPTSVVPLLSLRADDSEIDTLWSRPAPKQDLVRLQSGNGFLIVTPTFEPGLHWDTFADGSIAIASDDTYTIHFLRPDGSEELRIVRDLPPWPVSDQERELARDRVREAYSASGRELDASRRRMMEQRIETMTFAPTVPRVTHVRVDGSDRVWVGVSLQRPDSTDRIDVFERDGTLVGSLQDTRMPTTFFAHDRAAALTSDPATDVQQVVVLRLREGER